MSAGMIVAFGLLGLGLVNFVASLAFGVAAAGTMRRMATRSGSCAAGCRR